MKLYAAHKDGKLYDLYHPFFDNYKEDAEVQFTDAYELLPEQAGVELIEYAPVNATVNLVEAVKAAQIALLSALPFDDPLIQKHRPLMFTVMQDTQQKLGNALAEWEADAVPPVNATDKLMEAARATLAEINDIVEHPEQKEDAHMSLIGHSEALRDALAEWEAGK